MKNSTFSICNGDFYQTSFLCFLTVYQDKLKTALQAPRNIHEKAPMTNGAVCMISVMLVFVGLAVLGSTITAYESLYKDKKKIKSPKGDCKENTSALMMRKSSRKKTAESHDILEGFKSFLKCFCIIRNAKKILNTVPPEGEISCFQGMRLLCSVWIITYHGAYGYTILLRNVKKIKFLFEGRASQLILNGWFPVDIFLFLSGFLNAYNLFQKYDKGNRTISFFYFILKRFIRLTPVYMIVLGFNTFLFSYTGTGIIWPTYDTNPVCQKNWWKYLLFINNFEDFADECCPLWWYMAVDMQFYIISPLFIFSLMRWPRLGYSLILSCIGGSSIISFVLTYKYNLSDGFSRFLLHMDDREKFNIRFWEYFHTVYMKPYSRIIPYLAAVLLAHYLYKKDFKNTTIKNNPIILWCGWIVTAIFMWIFFFSLHKKEEIILVTAIYNGVKHLLFSCGLSWIIYLMLTGQAEFLQKFLSWKFFLPFSRLAFCAYLVHPLCLIRIAYQFQDFVDFSLTSMISMNLHFWGISYVIAFVVSLFYEVPVSNFLDWYNRKKMKKNSSVISLNPNSNHLKDN